MDFIEYITKTGYLLSIFSLKDCLEIGICSFISYRWINFLKQDITKPLDYYYYLFCASAAAALLFNLPTLITAYLFFLPTISVLFYFIHQRTLQRNIVQITNNKYKNNRLSLNDEWITVLIQSLARVPKQKVPFYCIIERSHTLSLLLDNPCPLNAVLSEPLLRLVVESEQLHQNGILWVQDNGHIKGINCTFVSTLHDDSMQAHNVTEQAELISAHLDALIIGRVDVDQGYTVIAQGVRLESVSIAHAIRIIKQQCIEKSSDYSLHRGTHEKQTSTLSH